MRVYPLSIADPPCHLRTSGSNSEDFPSFMRRCGINCTVLLPGLSAFSLEKQFANQGEDSRPAVELMVTASHALPNGPRSKHNGRLRPYSGQIEASKNGRGEKIGNDARLPHVAEGNPSTALYILRQLPVMTAPVKSMIPSSTIALASILSTL